MTASERVRRSLRGAETDRIPFTLYECFAPYCRDLKEHLRRGMGILHRVGSAGIVSEGVDIKTTDYTLGGKRMQRRDYHTPVGDVYTLKEAGEGTMWTREHLFKSPDDYKVIRYMLENRRADADYDKVLKLKAETEEHIILRDGLPLEPMQELITSDVMDCITFSHEWYDNRDMILDLYRANARFHEQLYEIVAAGPLDHANYGGNVIPEIIGPHVFRDYYMPHYNAAADTFHRHGKLLGTHLDGNNAPIMDLIGETDLDYIEAYDPSVSPSLGEARKSFKDKALWINWPSGDHYRQKAEVAEVTRRLTADYGTGGRLLFAVTEDLPAGRWDSIISGILDGLGYPE